jgi:preprotein translocase subunit SecE
MAVGNTPVDDELENEYDDEEGGEVGSKGITAKKGYATPGRRTQDVEEEKQQGNALTRPLYGLRDYWEGVRAEVQKVVWPTREEVRRLSIIVLIVMAIAAVVLGIIISPFFSWLMQTGFESPVILIAILVIAVVGFVGYLWYSNRRTTSY